MKITRTEDGRANLNIWRDGDEFFYQKSPIFLKEWTNIMYVISPRWNVDNIYCVDLSKEKLDFPNNSFDAVNANHVFEHLTPQQGKEFASEIKRVLKPGGIFRISVPDLEDICQKYIHYLQIGLEEPNQKNIYNYQWSVMEIFDQMVRDKSGGLMLEAMKKGEYNQDYLDMKYKDMFKPIFETIEKQKKKAKKKKTTPVKKSLGTRIITLTPQKLSSALKSRIAKIKISIANYFLKDYLKDKLVLDKNHPLVMKEAVKWMYDRLSLKILVEKVGFTEFKHHNFKTSDIPNWEKYDFDCSNYAERPLDPSVYIECRKPL